MSQLRRRPGQTGPAWSDQYCRYLRSGSALSYDDWIRSTRTLWYVVFELGLDGPEFFVRSLLGDAPLSQILGSHGTIMHGPFGTHDAALDAARAEARAASRE